MLGTLLATRAAIQAMQTQTTAGHIFNVDGAGADGAPTPNYAAYGATKSGVHPCHWPPVDCWVTLVPLPG